MKAFERIKDGLLDAIGHTRRAEKAKWLKRAEIKAALLDSDRRIDSLSGSWLNVRVGLPTDAEWREENFA